MGREERKIEKVLNFDFSWAREAIPPRPPPPKTPLSLASPMFKTYSYFILFYVEIHIASNKPNMRISYSQNAT